MKDGDRLIRQMEYNKVVRYWTAWLLDSKDYNPDWLYWVEYLKVVQN